MTDETTPHDDAALPPASLGSGARCRPIGAYVHTPTYDDLLAEIERLRITDAEREALAMAATVADVACEEAKRCGVDDASWQRATDMNAARAATLRGLLERLK
jgi:hypothetical protein